MLRGSMVQFSIMGPLDQPLGRRRLLDTFKQALGDKKFTRFRFIVAFAKAGPLRRLQPLISSWKAKGQKIEAIFGVDHCGTSAQALNFALDNFDKVYVTREPNLTFHPKMYAFDGEKAAILFIGSNNLTVGGTETNFEAGVEIKLDLPEDKDALQSFSECWTELLPAQCAATKILNRRLLSELVRDGVAPNEANMRTSTGGGFGGGYTPKKAPKSGLAVKPPSALPKIKVTAASKDAPKKVGTAVAPVVAAPLSSNSAAQGLAIQIKPHHNGEIFLSVTAALQNEAFFKWPFNGLTVPKKGSNEAYPQLTPDPRVNITVYGKDLDPELVLSGYPLNTVYYDKKSEIRVTASPLVGIVPDYSVMVMRHGEAAGIDYDITIYTPQSSEYAAWVAMCNQSMPGGGKAARKFGRF